MTKRRRIIQTDKTVQNVIHIFCLLMFLQLKGYYANSSNPVLLYSTTFDIRVANTSKIPKINTVMKGLEQGSAVDFLYRENLICWSDQNAELIQCAKYNATHTEEKSIIVSEGIITPTGMAIDWYTNNIYWTDGETNKIEVISIDKKYRRVLFWSEVDLARAIAVVPKLGLMFWTDWGEVPKIERAGMNGDPATRKVIVKKNIMWPNGITIDYNNDLIYWVDAKLQFLDVMDFDGNNRKRIIKEGLVYPYALTFYSEKLYWTDWKTLLIYTWDITSNGPIRELINGSGTDVPVDIKVFEESRQMAVTDHPCKNNKCSHLCLLSPNEPGHVCTCPTGVKLMEGSNTTCYNGFQKLLIVAQRSVILKISLDSPDFTPFTIPLKDLKKALTVDFDPKTEFIYWADSLSKTISRARLDGTEQSVVIRVGGVPDSIAIDPLARNVYWTDPVEDTITVARLDGSYKKIIIHDELYDPRAIALHPAAGWMFWSDWNERSPKIERANLDGSGRVLLVSEKVVWPNGIALDTDTNKLYWCDARTHKIEVGILVEAVCNMDGTDRRELHNTDILRIFGLTLLNQHLYWTDTQRRTLDRIDKDTGTDRLCMVEQVANMMGIKAVELGRGVGQSRCSQDNGGCSHLCFNRPDDYVCSCPLGLELDNTRKTCIEPEAFLIYSRKNVIGRISMDNDNNDAVLPIKDIKEVSALAVHVSGSKIYWSDSKLKTINRCSIDGSNAERILEGLGLVEGLAIDWSAQNIYWTDTATQRIEVARLDGSSRRALLWTGLKKPKSIVLDPRRGYMYWSELGSKCIKRAAMDGSGAAVVVEQAGRAHALELDGTRLYWAALDPPAVDSARTDGSARRVLADDVTMPYALALYGDRVFWGDWNTGVIESANKADGSGRKRVHGSLDYIGALRAWHRARAPPNQCGADNGGCAHLCLPLPDDFRCACPAHARLRPDNLTCADPEEYILYATRNAVGRIMVASGECNDASVPVTGLKNVRTIEFDPVNKHLYWMDEDSHSIRRVPVTYSSTSAVTDSTVVVPDLTRPYHMVLDVIGRALYYTCWDLDTINATSIENNSSGIIVQGENMMPRLLAFHQTKRILIWSDVGLGGIVRANVDGLGRSELARAANVSALAVDATTVYWASARQIHAVDIDGTNRRVVWQGGVTSTLAAYGGALYLSGGERALMRLPLHRRDAPAAPVPHVARLVAAIAVRRVAREHPCFGGRACGGAAGSCGAAGVCGCGVACAPHAPCPRRHFRCEPSQHCVPLEWKCDGQADCPDGSDEGAACDTCAAGLRCADGRCAAALGGCDTGAPCERAPLPDAFRCDERLCLAPRLLCDGKQHCEDGSDEAASACGYVQKDPTGASAGGGRQWTALGVCGLLGGAIVALGAAWGAFRRARRTRRAPHLTRALPLAKPIARIPPSLHSSDATGSASASDSLCGRYPRPTTNPPPSPATASGGRRRARPYRAATRPPPPTPASTDHGESETEHAALARAPPPSPAPLLY